MRQVIILGARIMSQNDQLENRKYHRQAKKFSENVSLATDSAEPNENRNWYKKEWILIFVLQFKIWHSILEPGVVYPSDWLTSENPNRGIYEQNTLRESKKERKTKKETLQLQL